MVDAADIKLHIGQDRMTAHINVNKPAAGRLIERADIVSAIEKRNIVFGVDDGAIDKLIREQIYDIDILIARGVLAEDGADGLVEYMFSFDDTVAPKVRSDGRVDYYDMNIIHPAKKGDVLCRLRHPTAGKDGKNILGQELRAKNGKPAVLPRGRNTALNDAGDALISEIDGQIKQNGKNIDILQEYEVKKDVDFSTGNIHFPGNVTVRGNVLSGFTIQSGGDVIIHGLVEKASITAYGNITLHGGMTGQGSGVLRAGGNIFAKYVENSHITATGKITAECIMHSMVRAGEGIELIGKKGLLVGGNAKAREYIKASTIGSQFATLTEIEVGSDPKLNDRLKDIKAEIAVIEAEQKKTDQALLMFRNMAKAGGKLPVQKALIYDKTVKISEEHRARQSSLKAEHDYIENAVKNNVDGFIRASNFIYSGVKVSIASNHTLINKDMQYCTLKSDGDGISVLPF